MMMNLCWPHRLLLQLWMMIQVDRLEDASAAVAAAVGVGVVDDVAECSWGLGPGSGMMDTPGTSGTCAPGS